MTVYTTMESPVGELLLVGQGASAGASRIGVALTSVSMDGQRNARAVSWRRDPAAFGEVIRQLTEYFAGQRTAFSLELVPRGPNSSSGSGAP